MRNLHTLMTIALFAGVAAAQGSDLCGGAQAIAGEGVFAFNNTGANTDGAFACGNLGSDVWFAWTAPATDDYVISTCGGAGFDTVLAAYSGASCPPGSALACNDDTCGLQSQISISATAGSAYLVRVGGFSNAQGSGTFEISQGAIMGGCDPASTGPDVIVGNLSGMSGYGGIGGVGAYSIGTTSCNVGDTELNWFAGNNNHPVIGQNAYRLKDGRFELIGISWLKHGFTALQGNLCCDCIPAANGTRLGVGCSDPYGSGLNGSQGGLGPRFQVNAHTGFFSYPFFQQGAGGDAVFKRIQIANSDLDPSQNAGAQYFGEGHYIAPDDAAAGNGNNNASWENMNVGNFSSGAWNLSLSGATNRGEPAIRAWQANDPSVTLEDVQIPNEGLFLVGSNATDNGDGTWSYEYAVHNLNSDRSGGSFTVPVAAGIGVTAIGFHDVDYHSGEPFDGTDWTGTRTATSVTWSTDDFSTSPDANAIRWGTLYNFRFVADSASTTSSATLGLFRPGTPSSVAVPIEGPAGPGADNFCQTSPNTAGPGALMGAQGSLSIAAGTFTLEATGSVPNTFGIFYYGPDETQSAFGEGFRCVAGGAIGTFRLPLAQADGTGLAAHPLDFGAPPANAGSGQILAGATWKFQWWYRDSSGGPTGFNLSDGLSATFLP